MGLADEMARTYQRATDAGLDEGAALTTAWNRHVLPTLGTAFDRLGGNITRQTVAPLLDTTGMEIDRFAAAVGLPRGLFADLLADSYPEIAALWQAPSA